MPAKKFQRQETPSTPRQKAKGQGPFALAQEEKRFAPGANLSGAGTKMAPLLQVRPRTGGSNNLESPWGLGLINSGLLGPFLHSVNVDRNLICPRPATPGRILRKYPLSFKASVSRDEHYSQRARQTLFVSSLAYMLAKRAPCLQALAANAVSPNLCAGMVSNIAKKPFVEGSFREGGGLCLETLRELFACSRGMRHEKAAQSSTGS